MILFSKFKQQGQLLFLDQSSEIAVDQDKKYFIILSPSLYWVKKVTLPLKYVHEVKKIAHTLFEETLPPGNYSFYVVKNKDDFFVFAYEDSELLALLSQKGIALNQISGISFAQFVVSDSQTPFLVDDANVLLNKDGIVVLLPAAWFDNVQTLDMSEKTPPKETIQLEQFSHIVDSKTLYTMSALLLLFIVVLLGEYFYFMQQKEQIENKREKLFKEYKLKPTLMQNRAILQHYKKRDSKAQTLRKYIDYFLKARLKTQEKISEIAYDGRVLKVTLQGVKKSDEKRILSQFYKEKIKLQTKQRSGKLIVEIKI